MQILHSGDGDGEPGEIQLAAVLYDGPMNFHRSVHAMNRSGRMELRAGDFVPADQLAVVVMTLCVAAGRGASFALHAWDNDDPVNDRFGLDFDDVDDDDEVLVGFRRDFGSELPAGLQRPWSRGPRGPIPGRPDTAGRTSGEPLPTRRQAGAEHMSGAAIRHPAPAVGCWEDSEC